MLRRLRASPPYPDPTGRRGGADRRSDERSGSRVLSRLARTAAVGARRPWRSSRAASPAGRGTGTGSCSGSAGAAQQSAWARWQRVQRGSAVFDAERSASRSSRSLDAWPVGGRRGEIRRCARRPLQGCHMAGAAVGGTVLVRSAANRFPASSSAAIAARFSRVPGETVPSAARGAVIDPHRQLCRRQSCFTLRVRCCQSR